MLVISVPAPLMRSERASRSGLIDAIEGGEIGVIEFELEPAKERAPRPSFSGERPFRFAKSAPPRTPALAARTLPHSPVGLHAGRDLHSCCDRGFGEQAG